MFAERRYLWPHEDHHIRQHHAKMYGMHVFPVNFTVYFVLPPGQFNARTSLSYTIQTSTLFAQSEKMSSLFT